MSSVIVMFLIVTIGQIFPTLSMSFVDHDLEVRTKRELARVEPDFVHDVIDASSLLRRRRRTVYPFLSSWVMWSPCNSSTCGKIGYQRRKRFCHGSTAEKTCLEPLVLIRRCLPCVPQTQGNTRWSNWGQWSSCSASCGQGVQHRDRRCLRTDGRLCVGHFREHRNCRMGKTCPAWSTWHPWGACSALCGIGLKHRSRDCIVRSVNLRVDSPGGTSILRITHSAQLEESHQFVTANRCPGERSQAVQCVVSCWSEWQNWSPCFATCGRGFSYRMRTCIGPISACSGKPYEYRGCYTAPCWSQWSSFTHCTGKCGHRAGKRFRTRACLHTTPHIPKYRRCAGSGREERPCPPAKGKSCQKWGSWSGFSDCSKTCGGGFMYKTRKCYAPPCLGPDRERKSCNINRCPNWNEWSSFGCCNATCGKTGIKKRTRTCRRGSPGVPGCEGPAVEAEECSPGPCNGTRPHVLNTTVCGKRNFLESGQGGASKKVVGGKESTSFGWPWHGSLQHNDCDGGSCGWKHLCGASLIAPYWFITAGHCSEDSYYRVNHNNPGDNWRVVFGMNRLHEEGTPYLLSRVHVHKNYSYINVPKADVALVKLRWPVKPDPNIMPICMPGDSEPQPGERCYITGWGDYIEPNGQKLIEAEVPVLSYSTCRKLGTNYTILEKDHHLCAGDPIEAQSDTCYGDSGGPLTCQREDGSHYLAGVTSFGFECGEPGHVGIYARMRSYESWVRSIIESVNDCS